PQSGDREIAIYRIIQELVTNSIKHASPDRIQIDVRVEGQTIVIMVADNGKGFDATQLEQTSGIGMKNIAARINLLKGTIHIQSEPGKGSTFTIALPA
ncbi:MAG TPA: ATP-binding protein, partial [Chitinophagales bacterium]|nr:ATP-binding protein [Chitinophagales bacterium]